MRPWVFSAQKLLPECFLCVFLQNCCRGTGAQRGSAALIPSSFQTELTFRSVSASHCFGCSPSLMLFPPKTSGMKQGVTVNYIQDRLSPIIKNGNLFVQCWWLKMNISSSYNRLSGVRDSFTFVIAAFLLKGLSAAQSWCHSFIFPHISSKQKKETSSIWRHVCCKHNQTCCK